MDKLRRDTMFADLSDHDIAEAVCMEMRRRDLFGCLFMFPAKNGPSVFVSSSPQGTIADYSAAAQLEIFAEVAALGVEDARRAFNDEIDTSFTPSKFVN